MSRENSNYTLLIEKLDQFIRKFYVNQLIRGVLYSVGLIILSFLLFTLLEYFFYFGSAIRKFFLISFAVIVSGSLGLWVIKPLVHYFRLGKIISHDQAAEIIGNHFTAVQDKLINILQLNRQLADESSRNLIMASIEQKAREVAPIPFVSAIDLGKNRKYLPYALPPLLLLLGLIVGAPSLIKDSTHRILKSNTHFEREAPFHFILDGSSLQVPQFEDFPLDISVEGALIPNNVFVVVNDFQYRMKSNGDGTFSYIFNNVQQDMSFSLFAGGVSSGDYKLEVLKKANILQFQTTLDYPEYLGRKSETLSNVGDLVVPEGTKVDWVLQSVNMDHLKYVLSNEITRNAEKLDQETYTFSTRVAKDLSYRLIFGNEALPASDSVEYRITVVPDQFPEISMRQFLDSSDLKVLYLVGDASDDYGLKKLTFNYQINNSASGEGILQSLPIAEPTGKASNFDHVFNVRDLDLKPGDEVIYYFEVWDNDGVNGSKSSRTGIQKFLQPTTEEFKKQEDANEEAIRKALEQSLKESERIKKDFKGLREKMLQEKSLDWHMKKELQDLLDQQKELDKEIEEAKDKFEENLENQSEFEETPEETLEKQEKLKELFEELQDEETRELMEKIQQLMEELNKDEALQMMEEMEFNQEELSMELERLKELFKELELERDVMQELDRLKELAEKEQQLAEETAQEEKMETEEKNENEDGANNQENSDEEQQNDSGNNEDNEKSLEERQKEINEAFKEISEKLDELEKRNEELQAPKNLDGQQEMSEEIEKELNQSLKQLQQNQKSKASQSQKQAGEKMQQMAEQMQQQMQEGDMEQMAEDMKAMRQLLENLIGLSFDQENLIEDFNKAHTSTPEYIGLVQRQHKLKDDFHLVEDSLKALSQRVYQIESFVLEKVSEINSQMSKSLQILEERKKAQAADHQQRVMKNVNDLALMFSESMNQMQQQMAAMMSGQQMCTKPGGAKPKDGSTGMPMDKITEGQKDLNGDMQKMKQGMEKPGEGATSKEFAQMAARQAALRKALRDLQNEKQSQGKGSKELEEILDQMDKIETDLVNKRFTNEMLKRQQEILTRLLESEKAEREQEYENKRESKTAKDIEKTLPPSVEEYLKKREAQIEPFKTISPNLKPYYKELVEEYYKSLKEN